MIHSKRADALSKKITDMHGATIKTERRYEARYYEMQKVNIFPFQRLRTHSIPKAANTEIVCWDAATVMRKVRPSESEHTSTPAQFVSMYFLHTAHFAPMHNLCHLHAEHFVCVKPEQEPQICGTWRSDQRNRLVVVMHTFSSSGRFICISRPSKGAGVTVD